MEKTRHPSEPRSNVHKLGAYDPNLYTLHKVSPSVLTNEALIPHRPPCLTQASIGMFLQPLTRELTEVPLSPTISELPDTVIEKMVQKDKAFWVDKPGDNAYTLHEAYYNYGMTTEIVKPCHQDVFPRSYQYDLDSVKHRRLHACDGLKQPKDQKQIPLSAHCRDCAKRTTPGLTAFELAWAKDPGQKRWRYYPDLTATLTSKQIKASMDTVGRPFMNEACNWYYENYPPVKHACITRKFST